MDLMDIDSKQNLYTKLQNRIAAISDEVIAEGFDHILVSILGELYYVFDSGRISKSGDEPKCR